MKYIIPILLILQAAAFGQYVPVPGGGGSQTPWTSDINAGYFKLNNLYQLWGGNSDGNQFYYLGFDSVQGRINDTNEDTQHWVIYSGQVTGGDDTLGNSWGLGVSGVSGVNNQDFYVWGMNASYNRGTFGFSCQYGQTFNLDTTPPTLDVVNVDIGSSFHVGADSVSGHDAGGNTWQLSEAGVSCNNITTGFIVLHTPQAVSIVSPNGTQYYIHVTNAGILTVTTSP